MPDDNPLARAIALFDAGRLQESESLFREHLQSFPAHPPAIHLLGLICSKTGRMAEAIELLTRSIAHCPNDAGYRRNLGGALRLAGRPAEACECYRSSLALRNDPDVLIDLANAQLEAGNAKEAAQTAQRAVQASARRFDAQMALGSALFATHRFDEALSAFQNAVNLDSTSGAAYRRLGTTLYHLGRFGKATEILLLADRLAPGDCETMNQIAMALEKQGRYEEARQWFSKVVDLPPQGANELFHRANALEALGRPEEAMDVYQRATALNPKLWTIGCATALEQLGRTDEALDHYRLLKDREPTFPLGHFNYGMALLRKGRFKEGWKEYDWRRFAAIGIPRNYPQPLWRDQDISGKRLLLYAEQGLGDTILMVRYVPLVLARGPAKLVLECQPELMGLFSRSFPGVEIVALKSSPPDFDLHASLFDLPLIFDTTLETVPAKVPYLEPSTQKVTLWRERLGNGRIKVGVVWAGGAANTLNRIRSMPLSAMAPLSVLDPQKVRFISLQKGPPAKEAANPPRGLAIEDYTSDLRDFDETAALIACLDMVITVDTAVAHLSGALGKRTWLPLPFSWFWLYLENRSDSPWYPTMRLFRQSTRGDWSGPMKQIAAELQKLIQSPQRQD